MFRSKEQPSLELPETERRIIEFRSATGKKIQAFEQRISHITETLDSIKTLVAKLKEQKTHLVDRRQKVLIDAAQRVHEVNASNDESLHILSTIEGIAHDVDTLEQRIKDLETLSLTAKNIDEAEAALNDLKVKVTEAYSTLEASLQEVREAEIDIARFSYSDLAEAKLNYDEQIWEAECISAIRLRYLEDKHKAEGVKDVFDSLSKNPENQATFLSNLSASDKELFENYQNSKLEQNYLTLVALEEEALKVPYYREAKKALGTNLIGPADIARVFNMDILPRQIPPLENRNFAKIKAENNYLVLRPEESAITVTHLIHKFPHITSIFNINHIDPQSIDLLQRRAFSEGTSSGWTDYDGGDNLAGYMFDVIVLSKARGIQTPKKTAKFYHVRSKDGYAMGYEAGVYTNAEEEIIFEIRSISPDRYSDRSKLS